jgi:putative tryptophan/tyrosine transport system substrate-binding protein
MKTLALATILALGLLAMPITAAAQEARKVYRLGLLGSGVPPSAEARARSPFAPKARELGWIVGWNIVLEERWAEGKLERLPQLAADLVGARVDVIVASGTPPTLAAKQATQSIPIVFVAHFPVERGIVKSLARPGGNLTGIAIHVPLLKHLELLKETLPAATQVTYLTDAAVWPQSVASAWARIEAGGLMLKVKLQRVFVQAPQDIESTFSQFKKNHPHALLVDNVTATSVGEHRLCRLAMKHRLPTIGVSRRFAEAGCLLTYGTDSAEVWRQVAIFVDRILRGTRPADLPVVQPAKFELVINLKTAKSLGLTIPQSLLLRADQVIE